jgi:hypothetical protein
MKTIYIIGMISIMTFASCWKSMPQKEIETNIRTMSQTWSENAVWSTISSDRETGKIQNIPVQKGTTEKIINNR